MTIGRILIAHDGSAQARRAVEVGVDLAARYGATVTVLTALHVPAFPATMGEVQEATQEQRRVVERFQREAVEYARLHGIDPRLEIVVGHPAEAIVEYARAHGMDLIVMGHRGMSNLQRFFVGSVADRVVDHAPCMVLVVGPGVQS
ncbi:MAG: universal stress protein [Armatimonadota bacterium]|nr:universal stress protein [Armatimonadota bacterium]MDR7452778.1 universal stress protein [Armatimonadota bacterium]MDR7468333.1 universal stress protein [Armatimonadota bacterium]MDR7495274.1 universal stress protein [Armatimonadota bacterium]MDR7500516.1 universal stress protein [Armatimonadota bacterium]